MEKPNNFRKNLIRLRDNANMSQEQLAEKLGISRQSISKWESGEAMPEMKMLTSLCDIFKVSLDDLVRGEVVNKKVPLRQEYEEAVHKYAKNSAFGIFWLLFGLTSLGGLLSLPIDESNPELTYFGIFAVSVFLLTCGILISWNSQRRFDLFKKRNSSLPPLYTDAEVAAANKKSSIWLSIGALILVTTILLTFCTGLISNVEFDVGILQSIAIIAAACTIIIPPIGYIKIITDSFNIEKYNYDNSEPHRILRRKLNLVWGIVGVMTCVWLFLPETLNLGSDTAFFFTFFLPILIGWIITKILKYKYEQ